ncbi:hypothetical protein AAG906_010354 [Vitis piasezkii]
MTPTIPPVALTTSEPSNTISTSEFHDLVATLQTLSTTHAALFQQMAPAEDTTTVEVQIPPPQEATTDAIASVDPQDEPQTVDIVTATPEDASSPHEIGTT